MKLLLSLLTFFCLLQSCSQNKQPPPPIPNLPVMPVNEGSAVIFRSYPASVEGTLNIEIRPQVAGILDKALVDDGQFVTKGEPMFQIEEGPFREKLNSALASYKSAKGAFDNAQIEIEKLTPLVQNHVVSDYQLRTAVSAKETASGNLEQAKADIATAKINLGYTLIKAPSNGYIGRLLRKQGSLVGPQDPLPLTEFSDVHQVHVFFVLGENDFIQFREQYSGRTLEDKIRHLPAVELVLADDSAYTLKGKIDIINGQFDGNTGAITFRATFDNPDCLLRSGNTGKVKLGLKLDRQLIVPQTATQEIQDQTFVFVVKDHNKVSKQLITITGKNGKNYLVKNESANGLRAGDKIVLTGFDHLHEGDVINPLHVVVSPIAKN